jgi:2-oxoglutarate dehydrogenase E2 component (dihydrolipoamide succinyltransferase)
MNIIIDTVVHKTIKVPPMADSITEGELARWEKQVGEFVKQDELIATIETDKVDIQVNSPESGTVVECFAKEGDSVEVGQDFYKIDTDGKVEDGKKPASKPTEPVLKKAEAPKPNPIAQNPEPVKENQPPKSPSAPQTQSQRPVPIPAAAESKPVLFDSGMAPGLSPLPLAFRTERRVKMNRMRQRISERLKESQDTAASLTTFNEVDMSNLIEFRNKYKDDIAKETGVKLGFMSAFVKASVAALKSIPAVNASIEPPASEDDSPTLVYHDYCDISFAVATPKGLVTPVLRNAETLSFVDVERAIAEFGAKVIHI